MVSSDGSLTMLWLVELECGLFMHAKASGAKVRLATKPLRPLELLGDNDTAYIVTIDADGAPAFSMLR
ncbi:hypothetical protein ACFL59_00995 [Planctomycetota bacterium]